MNNYDVIVVGAGPAGIFTCYELSLKAPHWKVLLIDKGPREICKRANDLSGGRVVVQKYGDILRGRRSTETRIKEGFLEPTLKEAVPGDLGLVLPYNTLRSLIEMVEALDRVTPGIASDHTLFYGVEAKFYSARPQLSGSLETEIHGLFCAGDGAGVTRGLAQAGAAGVWVARNLVR